MVSYLQKARKKAENDTAEIKYDPAVKVRWLLAKMRHALISTLTNILNLN